MNQVYLDTARMMMQVAPFVFAGDTFALKGGTAINLFFRDLPRLSVDLDLVFPNYELPRAEALTQITDALQQTADRLRAQGFQTHATPAADGSETKLMVRRYARRCKTRPQCAARAVLCGGVKVVHRRILVS
jgi:hypothetical protein